MDEPLLDEPLLLADVVQECSGLTPPKSVVSLSAQLCPDTAQIYAAWGAFTAWVAEALAEQTNVHLLDFATMSLRAYTLGIVIPTFVLSERFKRAYGLQQERTIDAAHNTQPPDVAQVWNLRGLANNSWHRVPLKPTPSDE